MSIACPRLGSRRSLNLRIGIRGKLTRTPFRHLRPARAHRPHRTSLHFPIPAVHNLGENGLDRERLWSRIHIAQSRGQLEEGRRLPAESVRSWRTFSPWALMNGHLGMEFENLSLERQGLWWSRNHSDLAAVRSRKPAELEGLAVGVTYPISSVGHLTSRHLRLRTHFRTPRASIDGPSSS
jgi:hypothetical protein